MNFRSKLITQSLSTTLCFLLTAPMVLAQQSDPWQIVKKVQSAVGKVSFDGSREVKVYRQNTNPLVAQANIKYADQSNFSIKITDPRSISGIQFVMKQGKNSAFFPDEKIYLFNGDKKTAHMPVSIIIGEITDNFNLLKKNYDVFQMADDHVALTPTYVLDFQPQNSKGGFKTPARRYWISQEDYQILREERYWDPSQNPYYENSYKHYKTYSQKTAISPVKPPNSVKKVDLSGEQKNAFLTYSTVKEAEAKEKIKIRLPKYVPSGFEIKNIQVFTLMGARIQVLNYTDGLNDLLITTRPSQNFFVTLLAGAFSLNLLQKMKDLSYHAPNNYMSRTTDKQIIVAFGDLLPGELKKTVDSVKD